MEIPVRNIIFLRGIFFKEIRTLEDHMIEENLAAQDIKSNVDVCYKPSTTDVRITKFCNKKQWSEAYKDYTLKCWYCGLSFKGIPCFLPRHIKNTSRGKEYDTQGLFCGFACSFSFLKSQSEFVKHKSYLDKLTMLKIIFTEFYNKRVVEFKEAPYIYDLSSYGGHVDIVEYRNELKKINTSMINEATSISNVHK